MVEVEEEGRGWLTEDVAERDIVGGRGRFHSLGNGRNGHDRDFQPSSRRDIRLELPPEPEPARFTDWSSIASATCNTFLMVHLVYQQNQLTMMQNQVNVPAAIGTRQEREVVNICRRSCHCSTTGCGERRFKYTYKTSCNKYRYWSSNQCFGAG